MCKPAMCCARFTRHFGVWREAEGGRDVVFDSLFPKGTVLPGPGEPPLTLDRSYKPVHNVGHFRYLECSQRASDGSPWAISLCGMRFDSRL